MKHMSKARFFSDSTAVIDLPMRLVVSLIIGTVALSAMIAFMIQPCLFPQVLSVSIDPLVSSINDTNTNVSFHIHVTDDAGNPVTDANVIIKGYHNIKSNRTDHLGNTHISFSMHIPEGISESYLDVIVKASCAATRSMTDCIKIVKQT